MQGRSPAAGAWPRLVELKKATRGPQTKGARRANRMQDLEMANTSHPRHQHDGAYIQVVTEPGFSQPHVVTPPLGHL